MFIEICEDDGRPIAYVILTNRMTITGVSSLEHEIDGCIFPSHVHYNPFPSENTANWQRAFAALPHMLMMQQLLRRDPLTFSSFFQWEQLVDFWQRWIVNGGKTCSLLVDGERLIDNELMLSDLKAMLEHLMGFRVSARNQERMEEFVEAVTELLKFSK